jgi:hypothetical protein
LDVVHEDVVDLVHEQLEVTIPAMDQPEMSFQATEIQEEGEKVNDDAEMQVDEVAENDVDEEKEIDDGIRNELE